MKLRKCFIFIFSFILFFNALAYAKEDFDLENVYNITKELSQEKYRGRLAGDEGNVLATQYIEDYFREKGLEPAGDWNVGDYSTYKQSFMPIVTTVNGPCSLKIYDLEDKLVKEYVYGTDFKESVAGASVGGTVKGRMSTSKKSGYPIYLEQNPEGIGENEETYIADEYMIKDGIKGMIVVSKTNRFRFRSPHKTFPIPNQGLVKVVVHTDVMPELVSYSEKGYSIEIKTSVKIHHKEVSNVVGILEGSDDSLPPLILSAHFDHVGFDADGTIYPGALDNASGIGILLESINVIKNSGNNKRTVIFVAFNAEEEGLWGSSYFVRYPPRDISKAECINFDMVGSAKDIPLTLDCWNPKTAFSDEMADIAESLMVSTERLNACNSDHGPFNIAGISAVTLIHYDTDKVHTPLDTIENISLENLKDVTIILNDYFYGDGMVFGSESANHNLYIILLAVAAAVVCISIYILWLKRKKQRLAKRTGEA